MTFLGMPGWMGQAECRNLPPDLIDVPYGDDSDEDEQFGTEHAYKFAEEFCAYCPVMTECARYAFDNKIETGVWGGIKFAG